MSSLAFRIQPPSFRGRIGFARRDITPPVGIYFRCWGAAETSRAQGVHRPQHATAMAVFGEDGPPFILVNFDAIALSNRRSDMEQLRARIVEEARTEDARVMVGVSHSHSTYRMMSSALDLPGGEKLEPYLAKLKDDLVAVSGEAVDRAEPATMSWQAGRCDLAANRDLKDPDPGRERRLTGFNPEIVADDTVLVGKVLSESGEVIGTVVHYACHPTTLAWENTRLSPDYVGALRETVENRYAGAPCLFLLGACGDLGPAHQYVGDPEVPDRHGRKLGYAALSALEDLLPGTKLTYQGAVESGAPLAVWRPEPVEGPLPGQVRAERFTVKLDIKPDLPTVAELEKKRDECADPVRTERLNRELARRRNLGDGSHFDLPVWIARIGDIVFVGYPMEAYSALQLRLRETFPETPVVAMNLVNGANSYLATEDLYDEDVYSIWVSAYARGSLERLIGACEAKIRELLR